MCYATALKSHKIFVGNNHFKKFLNPSSGAVAGKLMRDFCFMKTIQLKGKYAVGKNSFTQVDDEDFDYLNQWKWTASKPRASGSVSYATRAESVNGKVKLFLMHRVILGLTDSKILGDHKDRNGLNNQRLNLRIADFSQNASNRTSINKTSKYLGVSWDNRKGGWRACITFKGKTHKISRHRGIGGEEAAAKAYDKKAKEIHGEFANLNFKE